MRKIGKANSSSAWFKSEKEKRNNKVTRIAVAKGTILKFHYDKEMDQACGRFPGFRNSYRS
jgi:cobyrinic acid a,c-diamide synthase